MFAVIRKRESVKLDKASFPTNLTAAAPNGAAAHFQFQREKCI
jgi:hypothetical protein